MSSIRAGSVCSVPGCPEWRPCRIHNRLSARNHRGISRHRRGYGAPYERARAKLVGRPCELRLPGCTGTATTPQHTDAGDLIPACAHCNYADGARRSRLARAR